MTPPLLIIDEKRVWEPAGVPESAIISARKHLNSRRELDDSAIRVALVHGGMDNKKDAEWSLRRHRRAPFDLLILYTGETVATNVGPHGRGPQNDGVIYATRRDVSVYLAAFVDVYAQTGRPDAWLLTGQAPRPEADPAPSRTETSDSAVALVDGSLQNGDAALVRAAHGGIDAFATLDALARVPPLIPVRIQHTYTSGSPGDGLRLVERLRLGAFWGDAARRPLLIAEGSIPTGAMRALYADGISTAEAVAAGEGMPVPVPLDTYRDTLSSLRLPLPYAGTSHDRANAWGALRLRYGLQALRGDRLDAWFPEAARSLSDPFYWLILSRLWLRNDWRSTSRTAAWVEWTQFLNRSSPHLLAIDDEIESAGWREALEVAVAGSPAVLKTVAFDSHSTPVEQVVRMASDPTVSVLLSDLRMAPEDQSAEEASDARSILRLTGSALIAALKVGGPAPPARPTLPVVVLTASNKSWTYRHVSDLGADAYWVKEHPDAGLSHALSVEAAAVLLADVQRVVTEHDQRSFLWDFREQVLTFARNPAHLNVFARLNGRSHDEIENRLHAVARLVQQSYGYLAVPETAHRRASFDQEPVDVAYLCLWACINEILALRYAVGPDGDFELLDSQKTPVGYWSPGQGPRPEVVAQVHPSRQRALEPDSYGQQRLETQHAEILFELAGELRSSGWDRAPRSRWDHFLRCRLLRNELALEHGDIDSRRTATVADLRTLVTLWQWMLFA